MVRRNKVSGLVGLPEGFKATTGVGLLGEAPRLAREVAIAKRNEVRPFSLLAPESDGGAKRLKACDAELKPVPWANRAGDSFAVAMADHPSSADYADFTATPFLELS